jgi:hypothetical protein
MDGAAGLDTIGQTGADLNPLVADDVIRVSPAFHPLLAHWQSVGRWFGLLACQLQGKAACCMAGLDRVDVIHGSVGRPERPDGRDQPLARGGAGRPSPGS